MSIEAVNQFLTKVSEDQKLKDELSQAMESKTDRQAATKVAAQHGYNFTPEELGTQLEQIKAANELNEKELEAVAGGANGARTAGALGALGTAASSVIGGLFDL